MLFLLVQCLPALHPGARFLFFFFFFNDTATTEIYTLSLHDALPIFGLHHPRHATERHADRGLVVEDRKSTRLNSSHSQISYAVFCLKKKKNKSLYINRFKKKSTQPSYNNLT